MENRRSEVLSVLTVSLTGSRRLIPPSDSEQRRHRLRTEKHTKYRAFFVFGWAYGTVDRLDCVAQFIRAWLIQQRRNIATTVVLHDA